MQIIRPPPGNMSVFSFFLADQELPLPCLADLVHELGIDYLSKVCNVTTVAPHPPHCMCLTEFDMTWRWSYAYRTDQRSPRYDVDISGKIDS